MTPRQLLLQLRHIAAQTLRGNGDLLFGEDGAIVAADFSDEQIGALPDRAVVFNLGDETAHDNEPRISKTLTIEALLFVRDYSDRYGGWAVLEVLETQRRLLDDIGLTDNTAGIRVICRRKGTARPVLRSQRPLLYRALRLEARNVGAVNADDEFPPVTDFEAAEAGGTVTLSWTRPLGHAVRFDWRGVTVRRKENSAPTGPADGTAVATDLDDDSTTDAPGAGTWHYAAFAGYDSDNLGDASRTAVTTDYSNAATDSVTIT